MNTNMAGLDDLQKSLRSLVLWTKVAVALKGLRVTYVKHFCYTSYISFIRVL